MKIIIINQHTKNWGDEAAFLGFISALTSLGCEVSHVLTNSSSLTDQGYIAKSKAAIFPARFKSRSEKLIALIALHLPFLFGLTYFSKKYRDIRKIMSTASAVCVGPGGENIGAYKDYSYLLILQFALRSNKKVLFSGNSFNSSGSRIFDSIAQDILSKSQVLAREEISFHYLNSRGIAADLCSDNALYLRKYFQSAILPLNSSNIPAITENTDYTVFVPNFLWTWHPKYKSHAARRFLENLITSIFESLSAYGKIVILPQTYPYPNAIEFFDEYAAKYNAVIVPNCPSLEQIRIIANSKAVVGMRYHSIVFSALANQKCFSIGYERKITGFNKRFYAGTGILDLTQSSALTQPFTLPPIQEFPSPDVNLIDKEIANLLSLHSDFVLK